MGKLKRSVKAKNLEGLEEKLDSMIRKIWPPLQSPKAVKLLPEYAEMVELYQQIQAKKKLLEPTTKKPAK